MTRAFQLAAACVATLLAVAGQVQAGVIVPTGVHNDVSFDTVTNDWGWSLLYRGSYSETNLSISSVFGGAGEYLMIGAIQKGSSTIEVLAAALTSDVLNYTPRNSTHTANGVEWYYNRHSMGFAGLGDTINQTTADTNGPDERDRLSWHTGATGDSFAPTVIDGGYRAGSYYGLNFSTDWERVVFTASPSAIPPAPNVVSDPAVIPEPSAFAVFGIAALVAGIFAWRGRQKKEQAAA